MTRAQVMKVVLSAIAWKRQGARTKWNTPASLALWDAVEELERAFDPVAEMRRAVAQMMEHRLVKPTASPSPPDDSRSRSRSSP